MNEARTEALRNYAFFLVLTLIYGRVVAGLTAIYNARRRASHDGE